MAEKPSAALSQILAQELLLYVLLGTEAGCEPVGEAGRESGGK